MLHSELFVLLARCENCYRSSRIKLQVLSACVGFAPVIGHGRLASGLTFESRWEHSTHQFERCEIRVREIREFGSTCVLIYGPGTSVDESTA
jgi:hypothetical protein